MLKILLKRKKLDKKRAEEAELRAKLKSFKTREAELAQAIEEAQTDEEEAEVTAMVEELENQNTETVDALTAVTEEIDALVAEIEQLEAEAAATAEEVTGGEPASEEDPPAEERSRRTNNKNKRSDSRMFHCRSKCFTSAEAMHGFYQRSEIKEFLERVRELGKNKRSVKGVELTIPTVMLDLIRANLTEYSKLISRVRLRTLKGEARQNVLGKIPEAVWTEMVGKINELTFDFTQVEFDGFKIGAFVAVPNSYLYDSDENLGEEIVTALLYAGGYALDKAIVYGKGPTAKMPVGIVTRLAQQSQPAYWGANQGTWTDLHSTNVLKLNINATVAEAFFATLLAALGKADPDFSASQRTTWLMNRATHMELLGKGINFNSAGALVAGFSGQIPVEGGDIVELDFLPDHEIIGGYFDDYTLVEREGASIAMSEDVFFIEDQTCYRYTARYDGQPVVGEGFVVVNYANTDPTLAMDFRPDYANTKLNTLIVTAAASATAAGKTVLTVSGSVDDSPSLKYAAKNSDSFKTGDTLPASGWTDLTSGTTEITAAAGTPITVVELDDDDRVISVGRVNSVPKT